MSEAYAAETAVERERVFTLTAGLTDAELNRRMANGWSVSAGLAHLAFWDRYCLALIEEWERTGLVAPSGSVYAINEAVLLLGRGIPPKTAVQIVQAAADAIDRKLEALSPELEGVIEASGHVRVLRRALHRREHLDQIEKALA